jgi:hypothetical protein
VVRNWYQKVKVKQNFQLRASTKHDLPPFLERNTELCMKIKECVHEHLAELSSELLYEYLHNTVLPMLLKEENRVEKDSEGYVDQVKTLLEKYCPFHMLQLVAPTRIPVLYPEERLPCGRA